MGFFEDSGLDTFPTKHLRCKLKGSPEIFKKIIQKATRISARGYTIRSAAIRAMSKFSEFERNTWDERFDRIQTLEAELGEFLQPGSEDTKQLQGDAIGQLSFQNEYLKPLNGVPFMLLIIAIFKILAVPTMAVLTPVMAWILPYIFLKFFYKLPISQEQYGEIMKMMWSGNPFTVKGPAPATGWTMRSIVQALFMGFSFVQSLVQPLQNAHHLYKTDATLVSNGNKAIELLDLYDAFEKDAEAKQFIVQFRSSLEDIPRDPRIAIHLLLEQPERFQIALRDLSDLEVQWRIANCPLLLPALVIERGPHPIFQASEIFDLALGPKAVPSTISFTGLSHHAALTGPNGGGKSSFLRAVLQSVLLAQTFGVAPAKKLVIRRFGWICSGLRLQDAPGDLSMFETEVWFAANLLKRHSSIGPGLVIYDELFHSTNPPDGIRTAEAFLKQLWEKKNIVSIISTHVFSLVESAPESVQRICCSAKESPTGEIKFRFNIEEGVCTVSSVKNIWERFGLVPKGNVAVKAPVENLELEKK